MSEIEMLALLWKVFLFLAAAVLVHLSLPSRRVVALYGKGRLVVTSLAFIAFAIGINLVFSRIQLGLEWVVRASALADDMTTFSVSVGVLLLLRVLATKSGENAREGERASGVVKKTP